MQHFNVWHSPLVFPSSVRFAAPPPGFSAIIFNFPFCSPDAVTRGRVLDHPLPRVSAESCYRNYKKSQLRGEWVCSLDQTQVKFFFERPQAVRILPNACGLCCKSVTIWRVKQVHFSESNNMAFLICCRLKIVYSRNDMFCFRRNALVWSRKTFWGPNLRMYSYFEDLSLLCTYNWEIKQVDKIFSTLCE